MYNGTPKKAYSTEGMPLETELQFEDPGQLVCRTGSLVSLSQHVPEFGMSIDLYIPTTRVTYLSVFSLTLCSFGF